MRARTNTNGKAKQTGKFIGAYVHRDVKARLGKQAKRMDRSVAWLVEKLVSDGLERMNQTVTGVND